jgi:hypothetical protein
VVLEMKLTDEEKKMEASTGDFLTEAFSRENQQKNYTMNHPKSCPKQAQIRK